jgi:hypothetical protein
MTQYSSYVSKVTKVINGRVQDVIVLDFPKSYTDFDKVYHLANIGFDDRSAYMLGYGISEAEMQRMQNED